MNFHESMGLMARSKQKKVRRNLTSGKSESLAPIPKACIGRI